MRSNAVLIQQASGVHSNLLNLTSKDHSEYCAKHNIDYWCIFGDTLAKEDHPFWNKVELALKALDEGYEYIIWLDADTYIADDTYDLRDACPQNGIGVVWHGKEEWPEHEDCYDHFNTGVFYLNACSLVKRFLTEWRETPDDGHFWGDQHSFNKVAKGILRSVIHTVDYKFNSVPFEQFRSDAPVVAAWHGYQRNIFLRMDAMQEFITEVKLRKYIAYCDRQTAGENAIKYREAGQFDLALRFFERAAELGEDSEFFYRELASLFIKKKDHVTASNILVHLVKMNPEEGEYWRMLSGCADFLGENEAGDRALKRAEKLLPNSPEVITNRAFWNLRNGYWATGFRQLKFDFMTGNRKIRFPEDSCYVDGDDANTRIFIWAEQGLGDTIMFSRFLKSFPADSNLICEVQPPLLSLMSHNFPGIRFVPQNPYRSINFSFGYHCGMFSLPDMFQATPEGVQENIKADIKCNPEKSEEWKQKIKLDPFKINIGFSWAGSPGHAGNHNRNTEAGYFDDLVEIPNTNWICLQRDIEIPQEVVDNTPEVQFIGHLPEDMDDVAGIIDNLDIIITVDSAIAHLAGAMGKKCIVLLSKASDWRWLLDRNDTVWYDNVRLVRQKELGNWQEVFDQVPALIEELFHGE